MDTNEMRKRAEYASRNESLTSASLLNKAAYEIDRLRKENEILSKRDEFLSCLEGAGVDNWDGYADAVNMMEGANDDDDEPDRAGIDDRDERPAAR